MGFAVAAIYDNAVVELRFIADILGSEYHAITHGLESFDEETLDKLCFHEKTADVCSELFNYGEDVCFGVIADDVFIEL